MEVKRSRGDSFFRVMEWRQDQNRLFEEVEPVLRGMGYSLVEFSRQPMKGRLQVRIVIYRYSGIGLDDCEIVHRTVLPRIELVEQSEDIYLEVTSPGITRKIKYADEFNIFIKRQINVLCEDQEEWIHGTIQQADTLNLVLELENGTTTIPIEKIKKAKLAYSQEDK